VEAGLAPDPVSVGGEGDALLGDGVVEVGERLEVAVDDRLVDMDPEGFRGLEFRGVGRQVDEANALGHREAGLGVPAGAVEHEQDDAVAPGTGLAGEARERLLEELLVDAGGEVPEALAGGGRDEGDDVEPFVAVVADGDGARAARRPDPAEDRLQPDVARDRARSTRCSSVAKVSMTAPGWRAASSATASARFF
jgi:hypothetical protein